MYTTSNTTETLVNPFLTEHMYYHIHLHKPYICII